ncbi:hypothetical protein ACQR35_10960 [Pseudarthrobacter sp. J1738]|uniref:hypothetical protein n=1 Tax=Pseudarthrobacter sp. J1738 TaxID=3420446 RepID=UPI003D2C7FD3
MNEPRFIEMSVDAWCVFTKAIAWSNEAGTDGLIKRRYLALLHPQGEQPRANSEIADLGLWHATVDGYQFVDWNKKAYQGGLGQELAAVVQEQKDKNKVRQQKWRDGQKDNKDNSPVTRDVTGNVTRDVGQDRTRQAFDEGSTQNMKEEPSLKIIRDFPDCASEDCNGKLNQRAVNAGRDVCEDCAWKLGVAS